MGSFKVKMPEDFLSKVSSLGSNTDAVITKVLENGAAVVEDEVRTKLTASIGKDTKEPSKSTGQLLSALGSSTVKQSNDGSLNIKVGFSENRSDGKKNGMIANILEYGKSNQKARPFLKPAIRKSKEPCIEKMQETLTKEVEKL